MFDKARALFSNPAVVPRLSRVTSVLVPALYAAITEVGEDFHEEFVCQLEMQDTFLAAPQLDGTTGNLIAPRDFVPLPWGNATFDLAAFLNDDDIEDYALVSDTEPERITMDALVNERYSKPLTVLVAFRE